MSTTSPKYVSFAPAVSLERAAAHLPKEGAARNARTLFDINLPDEVVEHVLHMLSGRLRHVYPLCFVNPRDVLTVLEPRRGFALLR